MTSQIVPIYYAPDIDNAWSVAPGALTQITNFAPLQLGSYGSVGNTTVTGFSGMTGTDVVSAYMIRQINGSIRFFVNRATNIDEYDNAGTRTNRATALTSTADWSMCAQGNAVIACSIDNATQVSTGAGFAALGGSSPKAKHCASNFGFVMLANTDSFADQVAWCALNNYTSFAPSIATEAGNIRLLEAPGPITACVPYRDGFVAFKDNALFVAEYTGPNFVWKWRPMSHKIGCVGAKAVTELDGKLYFLHTSGFYEFDGQNITNVGLPVNQTFLTYAIYIAIPGRSTIGAFTFDVLSNVQVCADDIEGVVWFRHTANKISNGTFRAFWFCYNPRSRKWGAITDTAIDYSFRNVMVQAHASDVQSFKSITSARFLSVQGVNAGATTCKAYAYPAATVDAAASLNTGVIGSTDGSANLTNVYWRTLAGSDADTTMSVGSNGYTNENKNIGNGLFVGAVNTEFDTADILGSSRFRDVQLIQTLGKKTILAGIGIKLAQGGKR